ncbi:myc-regulated DEAD/H box 18 RNA helicase-like protein, partial [Ochromonadaceae sp. CCMP2298]
MAVEAPAPEWGDEKPSHVTDARFEDMPISAQTKRALAEVMRYRYMTLVQKDSLPHILNGSDVLVKAKTGTGKTLAFMIPGIEILTKERARIASAGSREPVPRILVLSPTRELAQQIVAESAKLCTFHSMGVVLLVGGTSMPSDVRKLRQTGPACNDIIVATPGRMLAHLQETPGFSEMVKGVKVYIMDEADRLLDMGFKRDIDKITRYVDQRDSRAGVRHTLLFSATVAPEIRQIASTTLRAGYKVIDCVGEEVEQTHAHVPQLVIEVPLDQTLRVMVQLLEQHMQQNSATGYKVIMFFTTARQTGYYAGILQSIGMKVAEIHSRKSQSHRTKVAEQFRQGRNMVMCSSDVSARGMDYPDVTFVLQLGMTGKDQYIHRLGRTARAGKSGAGLLMLAPFEFGYMTRTELSDMPLQHVTVEALLPSTPSPAVAQAEAAAKFGEDSDRDGAKMAWAAWLGYYNGQCGKSKLNMSKAQLVAKSAEYASTLGFSQMGGGAKQTIGKMGMQGVPG